MNFLKIFGELFKSPTTQQQASAYESSSTGRRLNTWGTSTIGPNNSVSDSLVNTVARSRESIRNNPYAASALEHHVSNLIGSGINPRWRLDDSSLKEAIQSLWADWTDYADSYGQTDFYGLSELVARAEFESGEALVRFRPRRLEDGLPVPLQLQIMEPDHLDYTKTQTFDNGRSIIMGIEFDPIGRRSAYHLFRNHPGDSIRMLNANPGESVAVPADQMLHIYHMKRPGQVRGMPRLAPILVRLRELDQYEDAELVRKKTAAMFSAFITKNIDETGNANFLADGGTDAAGQGIVGLEPGILQYLDPGEDIKFSDPADVGGNYEVWITNQLRSIAAGIGVTYEQLTGDLSGVNYSSIRAGLIEFRRKIEMLQHHMMVFQFCRPIAIRWLETAVAAGKLNIRDFVNNKSAYTKIEWQPAGFEHVDPLKAELAKQLKLRNGTTSRSAEIAKDGEDAEEIDRQIAEDNNRADNLGLIFDSDPRHTAKSGAVQSAETMGITSVVNSEN